MLKTISSTKTTFSLAILDIYIKATSNSNFMTPESKLAFLWLRYTFTKAFIFYYFDLKPYIGVETNACGYAIGNILS